MNGEDKFELRLAEWLEEGPFAAPDRVVTAAIDHARAHPRRRLLRFAFRRSEMSESNAASSPRRFLHTNRKLAAALGGLVVVVLVVASGAFVLALNGSNGPGPVAAPTATPVPTPSPAPTQVAVTGTITLASVDSDGTDVTTNGVERIRNRKFTMGSRTSDPRTTGDSTVVYAADIQADQSARIWGTTIMTGPDGTWAGWYAGLIDKGLKTHRIAGVLTGSGAYAGLQYRYTETSEDGTNFTSSGVIEAVPPYTATTPTTAMQTFAGTDSCETTLGAGSTQSTVGAVQQTRYATGTCTENMPDNRLNGTSTREVNEDLNADDTGTMWGTASIANSGGSWTGVFTATILSADSATVTFVYVGSGGYAGLEYYGTARRSNGPADFSVNGTVDVIAG